MGAHPRIALVGWYGSRNVGDELLCRQSVANIRRWVPGAEVTAFSLDPAFTRRYHEVASSELPSWPYLPRPRTLLRDGLAGLGRGLRSMRAALGRWRGWHHLLTADAVVVGGGGHFFDYGFGPHHVEEWRNRVALFSKLGKPVFLYGVGVGPIESAVSRRRWAELAGNVQGITVRDETSRRLCPRLQEVAVVYDPAVAYTPHLDGKVAAGNGSDYAAVNFRNPYNDRRGIGYGRYIRAAARVVQDLLARGLRVEFFPMHPGQDEPVGRAIAERLEPEQADGFTVRAHTCDFDEMATRLAAAEVCVGMRLHFNVLSVLAGRPPVAVGYAPKVKSFMEYVGLADLCVSVPQPWLDERLGLRRAEMDGRVEAVLHSRAELARQAGRRMEAMRQEHDRAGAMLRRLLGVAGAGAEVMQPTRPARAGCGSHLPAESA